MDDIARDPPADTTTARPGRPRSKGPDDAVPYDRVRMAEEQPTAGDTTERDEPEDQVPEADPELPEVPELADPEAVGRLAFVLLLSQRDGLSLLRLAQSLNTSQKLVERGLERLQDDLRRLGVPVELGRTESSVRLLSMPESHPYLVRLRGVKQQEKLSQAALETLAVIAYRQPVLRSEIEAIRGVKAGPMLRTLLQHKLVKVTGRADVPGRPLQYGTTPHFLERFGLQSLKDLPSLKEWKQLG
jgi:segregation and condensation protein B